MDLSLIMGRLKKYRLGEYNCEHAIIFVPANDPDTACYEAYMGLCDKIIKQGLKKTNGYHDASILEFAKDIMNDVRVIHVGVANEKKL